MHEVEKRAEKIGVSEAIMMENAGSNVARILDEKIGLFRKHIFLFCGTGNKAGDGLVFARHSLIRGARVNVYFAKRPEDFRTDITRRNFYILDSLRLMKKPLKFYFEKIPEIKTDILVDALLGTGLKGKVSEEYAEAIKKFNGSRGFKVSIDCPSGIDCDTGEIMGAAARPDLTVTFYDVKKGLNPKNSGEIIITCIGIPKI